MISVTINPSLFLQWCKLLTVIHIVIIITYILFGLPTCQRLNLLCVAAFDGEFTQLELIRHTTVSMGHECQCFVDRKVLLNELEQSNFDLLILGWNLPEVPSQAMVDWISQELSITLPVLLVGSYKGDTGAA